VDLGQEYAVGSVTVTLPDINGDYSNYRLLLNSLIHYITVKYYGCESRKGSDPKCRNIPKIHITESFRCLTLGTNQCELWSG